MTNEEIEKFIDRQQKISDRNYYNYQDSGETRYLRAHEKAEDMIDLARRALNADEDHEKRHVYSSCLTDIGTKVIRTLHHNDDTEFRPVLKDIRAIVKSSGVSVIDPWEGESRSRAPGM